MVGTTVNGVKITQSAYDRAVRECAKVKPTERRYQIAKKAVIYSGGKVASSKN